MAGERKQPNLHEMRAFFLGPEHSLLDAPSSFHGDHRYTTSLDLRVERHEKEEQQAVAAVVAQEEAHVASLRTAAVRHTATRS